MRIESHKQRDPLTAASNAVAVVIALNKPIYPVYVWFLAKEAFHASLFTMISFAFYAALPFVARRSGFAARAALVGIGAVDTLAISLFMGLETGAYLFLAPCLMLASVAFYDREKWWSRGMIATILCLSTASLVFAGDPWATISPADTAALYKINAAGALSLMAFIGFRYPHHPGRSG